MAEKPILFSGAMVRAILAGTKTQTRRLVKCDFTLAAAESGCDPIFGHARRTAPGTIGRPMVGAVCSVNDGPSLEDCVRMFCPYGAPGDQLWVRETWAYCIHAMASNRDEDGPFVYAADGQSALQMRLCDRWRPSIHMPRGASRITLEITGVRVERLQDISQDDAYAEGAVDWAVETVRNGNKYPNVVAAYRALWESITGCASWNANPWVWVVEFKRVTP